MMISWTGNGDDLLKTVLRWKYILNVTELEK